jgi:hypothetical protein
VEDQEHLRGPAADALDLGERGDHVLVGELGDVLQVELPAHHVAREILHVGGLGAG